MGKSSSESPLGARTKTLLCCEDTYPGVWTPYTEFMRYRDHHPEPFNLGTSDTGAQGAKRAIPTASWWDNAVIVNTALVQ
eukprot:3570200-Rhodomonas_salina.1